MAATYLPPHQAGNVQYGLGQRLSQVKLVRNITRLRRDPPLPLREKAGGGEVAGASPIASTAPLSQPSDLSPGSRYRAIRPLPQGERRARPIFKLTHCQAIWSIAFALKSLLDMSLDLQHAGKCVSSLRLPIISSSSPHPTGMRGAAAPGRRLQRLPR